MPENNLLQQWSQSNTQIQQNIFIQNQQDCYSNDLNSQQNSWEFNKENSQNNLLKQSQTIYYHPSLLTKILSWIFWFIWIALIRSWLWNFSLIGSDSVSFWKILYVWWSITLCWILYILLWWLLYNTKKTIHLWISLLWALAVNVMFARILRKFTNHSHLIDGELLWVAIVIFTLIYFLISTIKWIIKCCKLKKKWIINSKYLNPIQSKKKVWYITTSILLLIVVINLIYGKLLWSKIPKIDESIFQRSEHQTQMPEENDAIIQFKKFEDYLEKDELWQNIESFCFSEWEDEKIWWKQHGDECIVIHSWSNSYCRTRTRSRKTLNRLLNRYYNKNYLDQNKESNNLEVNWKEVTIMEYLDKNEHKIRDDLFKLNNILSLGYYIPGDEIIWIIPNLQPFARKSRVILQYYTLKKDWDMVMLIININYKMIDIANHVWGTLNSLISFTSQGIINHSINSSIKLFPEEIRMKIISLLSDNQYKNNTIKETAKWEYVAWTRAKKVNILKDYWINNPSLTQFIFHFPFYSYKDTENLMLYSYNMIYNWEFNNNFENELFGKTWLLYNIPGNITYSVLQPRGDQFFQRLNRNMLKRKALITNLNAWDQKVRYDESDRKSDPSYYEQNLIPSIEN